MLVLLAFLRTYELVDPFSELTTHSHSENWLVWNLRIFRVKSQLKNPFLITLHADCRRYVIDLQIFGYFQSSNLLGTSHDVLCINLSSVSITPDR